MLKPLYIIPARGGSKGIPRKNIRPFLGKPLIAYSIEVALEGDVNPERVILSTDDEEIAAVAEDLGLPVSYRRPASLATDTAGSREVILDAMEWAEENGIEYDVVVLLQPTSPLRRREDIDRALALYKEHEVDMVVSVTEAACNPYYDCFETDKSTGLLYISKGDGLLTRRQDAPKVWQYNGAVYIINPLSIKKMALGTMPRRLPVEMPRDRSVDLDTPLDWTIAEIVASQQLSK